MVFMDPHCLQVVKMELNAIFSLSQFSVSVPLLGLGCGVYV